MAAREPVPPRNGASARIAEALRIEMAQRGWHVHLDGISK